MGLVTAAIMGPWIAHSVTPAEPARSGTHEAATGDGQRSGPDEGGFRREIEIAGYAGGPWYYRSDVHLTRPDGTDLVLKRLGWDGDALYFPIDGGVRSVEWWGSFGLMIDFLHNKAIARLGRGAHGRKLANPLVEDADVAGTLKGERVEKRVKLTDVFERLEFTHGHNTLLLTPLIRTLPITPSVTPYFGFGVGVALPHVEVWFPGDDKSKRTSEYQYAGPAGQFLAGLELRSGRMSYFIEYKFMVASIDAALTGEESWKNWNIFGDMWNQFMRWREGKEAPHGRLSTTLATHTVVGGAGYWTRWGAAKPR